MSTQTVNYCNGTKADARAACIDAYRIVTNRQEQLFPVGTQFITLCAEQSDDPLCELSQMLRLGMTSDQYVGIDSDEKVINENCKRFPDITFIHGDWIDDLMGLEPFTPAYIHLDTKNLADYGPAIAMLGTTMELCPAGCFIAANFVTRNPYSGEKISIDSVLEGLAKMMGEGLNSWKCVGSFSYCGDGCSAEMSYLLLLNGGAK